MRISIISCGCRLPSAAPPEEVDLDQLKALSCPSVLDWIQSRCPNGGNDARQKHREEEERHDRSERRAIDSVDADIGSSYRMTIEATTLLLGVSSEKACAA
jgi:hypothetical protein